MQIIRKYFPEITARQEQLFSQLLPLYSEWNSKINLISRKDIENLYERHVLHSLAIAKIIKFKPGTQVMDIGTGGGFPGIPLAIFFPETDFILVDSIAKKIKVVNEIIKELNLKNTTAITIRAEEIKQKFDFITGRAVSSLPEFLKFTQRKFSEKHFNSLPNGILYLHGTGLELSNTLKKKVINYKIKDFFEEEFFETKEITFIPRN